MTDYILAYYQEIRDGRATVGKYVREVYQRIVSDLENKRYIYDAKKANRAIKFIESFCHHSKGKFAPGLVKLELWQRAMIACIFGLVDEDGSRHYREVLTVIGRKNGKSLLASGIAEYMFFADGEKGADVFFIAPKLELASIVYSDFVQSIASEPELQQLIRKRRTDIYAESTNSSAKMLPFSQKKSDGLNPHLTICDELAAWSGDAGLKQYEVLASSLGARTQPMIFSITTANYVKDGIYDEMFKRSTAFLNGDSREQRILPFLYTIDDPMKWADVNELKKSMPNLGVSVSVDFILEEISKAEGSLSKKTEFLTKYANVPQSSSAAWLRWEDVEKCCGDELNLEDFRGCYCVGGIDLSQTTDLTACCIVVERAGELYVFEQFFMPSSRIEVGTAEDGVPYDMMRKRGWLTISGENYVDYTDCFTWFRGMVEKYQILPLQVGYDRYSSQYLISDMRGYGFHCDDVYQGWNLSTIIRDTEGIIKDGKLHIGNNQLLKSHFLNSALKIDAEASHRQLIKVGKRTRIDGMAALLDAMTMRSKYVEIKEQLKNGR